MGAHARRAIVDPAGAARHGIKGIHLGARIGGKGKMDARLHLPARADPQLRLSVAPEACESPTSRPIRRELDDERDAERLQGRRIEGERPIEVGRCQTDMIDDPHFRARPPRPPAA